MIKISNLSHGFESEKFIKIIDNLNFEASSGESVAIVGKSGSGKSSLLSLISGISTPNSGEIEINGTKLSTLNLSEIVDFRARNVSTIFQDFKLISHLSVYENISLALEIKSMSDDLLVNEVINKVGLEERRDSFPSTLSGGERQRVAIARALCAKTNVILADEPNANLDIETGQQVMELLFNLVDEYKKTLILVTHDQNLSKRCQSQYLLENFKLTRIN